MSQHIVEDGKFKFVLGWDQMLMSFFLQVHDSTRDEEENPVIWLGVAGNTMYEVEDLVREAKKYNLDIDADMQTRLYAEKDDGV